MCIFQGGCALLNIPGKIVDTTLKAAGGILGGFLKLLGKIPKPGPGAF
jgi:hypothetical protein